MVMINNQERQGRTLFLLVTCSMDEQRGHVADLVTQGLCKQLIAINRKKDFIAFDNGSQFTNHFRYLPKGSVLCKSSINIGYWSAIYWVLKNYRTLLEKEYSFIYIIESDLIQYELERISECEEWLEENHDSGSVRCQDYSVKWRWLYDKKYGFLPFSKKHSLVAHYNGVTHDKIVFRAHDKKRKIIKTNFHAKLPAINRLSWMCPCFEELAIMKQVSELEFMKQYHKRYQNTGVLDGGIFRSLGNDPRSNFLTGSYSSQAALRGAGYFSTRIDRILKDGFSVECSSIL